MIRTLLILLLALLAACGDGSGSGAPSLQDSCVQANLNLVRSLPNGIDCANFGYGDCDLRGLASECVGSCAFNLCQAAPCTTDLDCAPYDGRECQSYTVETGGGTVDYGTWCAVSTCPKGTAGCPCLDGLCAGELTCSAAGVCEDTTCPYGCRQGSVCCGGAFCAGDCIGTPCC